MYQYNAGDELARCVVEGKVSVLDYSKLQRHMLRCAALLGICGKRNDPTGVCAVQAPATTKVGYERTEKADKLIQLYFKSLGVSESINREPSWNDRRVGDNERCCKKL